MNKIIAGLPGFLLRATILSLIGIGMASLFTPYSFMEITHWCIMEGLKFSLFLHLPLWFKYVFGFIVFDSVGIIVVLVLALILQVIA